MKRIFNFNNVKLKSSYFGSTITGNVKVEMELANEEPERPVLSVSAYMYDDSTLKDIMGGQCLGTLMDSTLKDDPLYCEIHRLWSKYHLNDMHAGTHMQEAMIEKGIESGELADRDYTRVCDYLKTKHCYIDNDLLDGEGHGYKYGHKWLYQPIPEDDLDKIKELLLSLEYDQSLKSKN